MEPQPVPGSSPPAVERESQSAGPHNTNVRVETANDPQRVFGLSLADVKAREPQSDDPPNTNVCVETANDPLQRVENLLWIKGNTIYKEALDDWEQQKKSLGGKLERREKRAEELTNQVFNLVGFFSVFQGVILTAVTQLNSQATATPPRPLCNKVWYPLALSLLALVAAAFGIVLKFIERRSTKESIRHLKSCLTEAEKRESLLRRRGEGFRFKSLPVPNSRSPATLQWQLYRGLSVTLDWRLFRELSVIVGLATFTLIFCLSYFAILCDELVPRWL